MKAASIDALTDSERYQLHQKVFDNEHLVDMRAMFAVLLDKVGRKQVIDPVTKEDGLWRIVEFFTRPGV